MNLPDNIMSARLICKKCIPLLRQFPADRVVKTQYSAGLVLNCMARKLGLGPDMNPDKIPEEIQSIIQNSARRKIIICGDDTLYIIESDSTCTYGSLAQQRHESSCLADIWAGQRLSHYYTIVK